MKKSDLYGTWRVRTEGDVEGRTIADLGTFTGFVDEIALYLSNKCYYSLEFKKCEDIKQFNPTGLDVSVRISDLDSWRDAKELFSERPVEIGKSNYYESFKIKLPYEKEVSFVKERALSKLTEDEKEALGL